jgi:CDP-paratose 2-epimerase
MPDGIDESTLLDFHSPYGCSKGAAEQYVRDYSRIYGLPTVVIRQSCIYGPNQFGIEDQGWVAWFSIAAMLDCQISIFGDGNQVRDVLYVNDAATVYHTFMLNREKCNGQIYNLGGGVENQLSLNQLLALLSKRFNKEINPIYKDWRPGDQKVYVSNIHKLKNELGWQPQVNVESGVNHLIDWISDNTEVLKKYVFKNIASVA